MLSLGTTLIGALAVLCAANAQEQAVAGNRITATANLSKAQKIALTPYETLEANTDRDSFISTADVKEYIADALTLPQGDDMVTKEGGAELIETTQASTLGETAIVLEIMGVLQSSAASTVDDNVPTPVFIKTTEKILKSDSAFTPEFVFTPESVKTVGLAEAVDTFETDGVGESTTTSEIDVTAEGMKIIETNQIIETPEIEIATAETAVIETAEIVKAPEIEVTAEGMIIFETAENSEFPKITGIDAVAATDSAVGIENPVGNFDILTQEIANVVSSEAATEYENIVYVPSESAFIGLTTEQAWALKATGAPVTEDAAIVALQTALMAPNSANGLTDNIMAQRRRREVVKNVPSATLTASGSGVPRGAIGLVAAVTVGTIAVIGAVWTKRNAVERGRLLP